MENRVRHPIGGPACKSHRDVNLHRVELHFNPEERPERVEKRRRCRCAERRRPFHKSFEQIAKMSATRLEWIVRPCNAGYFRLWWERVSTGSRKRISLAFGRARRMCFPHYCDVNFQHAAAAAARLENISLFRDPDFGEPSSFFFLSRSSNCAHRLPEDRPCNLFTHFRIVSLKVYLLGIRKLSAIRFYEFSNFSNWGHFCCYIVSNRRYSPCL